MCRSATVILCIYYIRFIQVVPGRLNVPLCDGVDGSPSSCDSPEPRKVDEATALQTSYLLDRYGVSDEFYHELTQVKLKLYIIIIICTVHVLYMYMYAYRCLYQSVHIMKCTQVQLVLRITTFVYRCIQVCRGVKSLLCCVYVHTFIVLTITLSYNLPKHGIKSNIHRFNCLEGVYELTMTKPEIQLCVTRLNAEVDVVSVPNGANRSFKETLLSVVKQVVRKTSLNSQYLWILQWCRSLSVDKIMVKISWDGAKLSSSSNFLLSFSLPGTTENILSSAGMYGVHLQYDSTLQIYNLEHPVYNINHVCRYVLWMKIRQSHTAGVERGEPPACNIILLYVQIFVRINIPSNTVAH